MAKKMDSHATLHLLFQRDGVTPKNIVVGSKEQTLGDFKRKVVEAGCYLRQTEPESPWKVATEGIICERKRGSGRKITKIKSPKVLWDNCLELEAYIRSKTDLDIFELDGMTPNTKVSGETFEKEP